MFSWGGGGGGGGNSKIKRTGMLVVPLRGLKCGLGPVRVFSLKRSTAGAFEVPLDNIGDDVLFWNCYLLGVKYI